MGRRRIPTGTPLPKALACAMLEDNGRVLFLVRKDERGTERIEMPCVLVPSGRSPYAEIKEAFPRMTGIDAEIHEAVMEGRYNAGSRKRRQWVPCIVFKATARKMFAKPSAEFSGFRWLSLEDAGKQRLSRTAEWLLRKREG
ncbi:MAG: NUDIX hydrolase [Candidatus Micrarchaeota archaeon]